VNWKLKFGLLGLLAVMVIYVGVDWLWNRVQVPDGHSLQLRYKGPMFFGKHNQAEAGNWAKEGEVGILEKLRGPGRHFYCPIWWERTIVPDVIVKPGEVGLVTCKLGASLPEGEFLVDGEIGDTKFKGTLRKVLGPGRYRVNPYGYEVKVVGTHTIDSGNAKKQSGWVNIPTGYVGVVSNLADNPITHQKTGIQDKVLPPGLYPMNPAEQHVDVVEIGFHETHIDITSGGKNTLEMAKADEEGNNLDATLTGGINFPSADGFSITMDYTAVWGLMPNQAPNAIRKFGNVGLVEQKVVLPQIESICRNNGSEYPAVKLLVGEQREIFQNKTLTEFQAVLAAKDITLLYGLVRHIYIPTDVRRPIQTAYIADELKLTREVEQLTAKKEAELREAERKVEQATLETNALTTKLVAEKLADGDKIVAETDAETRKLVATINKQTAELKAQATLVAGQAEGEGKMAIETAKASKFKMAVTAFGTPAAYNNWVFATALPDGLELNLFYSGTGTLWTDLNGGKFNINVPAPAAEAPKK
jgi:regulator of protease activity HflC (stomatin/prohibitin superfamily)